MPFSIRKNLVLFFLIIAILVSFGLGFSFGKLQIQPSPISGVINKELGKPEGVDFSLFWEAWRKLEEKFIDSENIDYQEMIYGAISGMLESLNDDYTVFLPPEEAKIFKEDVSGEFQGVGIEIGTREGELTVIAPLEGTPAQRAGLRAGDKIIKVDEIYTRDVTVDEVVKLIRGPKGTEVILTILRKGWEAPKEFKIIRDVIAIPSLKWEPLASTGGAGSPRFTGEAGEKDSDIAYIKIYHFSEKASFDFHETAIEILDSSAKKIILDLRNNPGGYLEVAQDIAGWFLERGQIVAIEEFGEKNERKEYKAQGNARLAPYSIVILINQGSASGSEILAGALRDNRDVKLIGETSFGKGSVQELAELRGGSNLKITVARWLTPKGEFITDKGLEPDIEVVMTEEDYEAERDPQLDRAIEILKEIR